MQISEEMHAEDEEVSVSAVDSRFRTKQWHSVIGLARRKHETT